MFKAVRAPVTPSFVRGVVEAAAGVPAVAAALPAGWGVAVRITGDRELRRLNREFLGEDHATDVLSFPSGEAGEGYLGDLAVSWPAVVRQAEEFGYAATSELALLLVHGLLHLLGWDHATAAEEGEMAGVTVAALAAAGVALPPDRLGP